MYKAPLLTRGSHTAANDSVQGFSGDLRVDEFPWNDDVAVVDNVNPTEDFSEAQPTQLVVHHDAGIVLVQTTWVSHPIPTKGVDAPTACQWNVGNLVCIHLGCSTVDDRSPTSHLGRTSCHKLCSPIEALGASCNGWHVTVSLARPREIPRRSR